MKAKKFFGWENIRWGIKEVIKIYSSGDSFFSKKRIESGIAFIVFQWGMIFYLLKHINMEMMEMAMWAGIEATVCGYVINQIEKSKIKPTENEQL